MSDLFLGATLSLVLLVPVLLRPFLRRLQRVEGITVLPLVSLATCALVCVGSGFSVTLLPVVFYCLIAFITTSARLVRHVMGLPTDWYSPWSTVWHVILILGFAATAYGSWAFRGELAWLPSAPLSEKTRAVRVSTDVSARVTAYEPASATNRGVVLFFGNGVSPGRPTAARMLASGGRTAISARFRASRDFGNPLVSLPVVRDACVLLGEAFSGGPFLTDDAELAVARSADIDRLVRLAATDYGSVPLFAVAEGDCVPVLLSWMSANPGKLAGAVFILPESALALHVANRGIPELTVRASGMMPPEAGSYPVVVLAGEDRFGFGFGELCADDFLAAALLVPDAARDEGRKSAELAARRIETYLSMREAFNDRE
jgi:hypothetical protein